MMNKQNDFPSIAQTVQDLPPLVRELPSDLETPVSVYLKLCGNSPSFLLESITGGENLARYSFIGIDPRCSYVLRKNLIETHCVGSVHSIHVDDKNLLSILRAELETCHSASLPGLPRFTGGLAGYFGYEMMRFFEPSVPLNAHPDLPDAILLLTDTVIAFDHAFGRLLLIARPRPAENRFEARREMEARLDGIEARLRLPIPPQTTSSNRLIDGKIESNLTPAEFTEMVVKAKEHIAAGDIFQVVLSQCLSRDTSANPFDIYRALRFINPSPYMFFFDFAGLAGDPAMQLIGASPELHVRLEDQTASLRPIAGTAKRSTNPQEDTCIEAALLADPKERAEHVMLVDLARNDLGRVCEYGSVNVPDQMVIERYSHVMHIVSQVEGKLRPNLDAFDLMKATFPAGTVSGAPKIRAMQIINDLEPSPRGTYAGTVGYFTPDGAMDTCITIRTILMRGSRVNIQAGAGIVADSNPEREYQESMSKARALAAAVELAETNPAFNHSLAETQELEAL